MAVSEDEAQTVSRVTGKACQVIPNGVDPEQFTLSRKKDGGPPTIIFIGNLKYLQNDRGIKDFLNTTYPLIKKELPDIHFKIVSGHAPGWLDGYRNEVELIVDDRTPFYSFAKEADLMINPVRVKGGTRIKILEALASALPVVTYGSSLDGFPTLKDNTDVMVAEDPKSFTAAVLRLLREPILRDKISQNGRVNVTQNYTWEKSLGGLSAIYKSLT